VKKAVSLILALTLLCVGSFALSANPTFTLMIYMCAGDLEYISGAATQDLNEMIQSRIPEDGDVTVYIQTGGTKEWRMPGLTNRQAERWVVGSEELRLVESLGWVDMGKKGTLEGFLLAGLRDYPADRYGLILWDHGFGPAGGVCQDEISRNILHLEDIFGALETASHAEGYHKFAFIGLDACLMAAYETACYLQPFADYMIASVESEPAGGWSYGGWLPALVQNPGISVVELGTLIVDSYISAYADSPVTYACLSVADLHQLDPVRDALEGMAASLHQEVEQNGTEEILRTRRRIRSFGRVANAGTLCDTIDMLAYADAFGQYDPENAGQLRNALDKVVIYNGHHESITGVSGLSVLFPTNLWRSRYSDLVFYDTMRLSPAYCELVLRIAGEADGE